MLRIPIAFAALAVASACAGTQQSAPPRGIPDGSKWGITSEDQQIVTLSASELARRIDAGEFSSVQVVRAFIGQIAKYNERYNALVFVDVEGALKAAAAADAALAQGKRWGPLHGVPVTLKDTIATEGIRSTAGDPSLMNYMPKKDAVVVELLKKAGAIVLGKTNPAQLAMDMQTTNPLFGTPNNPWNIERTVGGSSGGCATAIATHMSPLSFGSDLAGSIRLPAAYTGVFGLRPTRGVISFQGHIPPLPGETDGIRTMAVLGPLASSVEDLELALSVLTQPSLEDSTPIPLRPRGELPSSVAGLRIAYMDQLGGIPVSHEMSKGLQRVINALRAAGAKVVRAEPKLSYERTWETWGALVGMQGGYDRSNFERWFGRIFAYGAVADIPHQRKILDPISVEGYMQALTEQAVQTNALERFLSDYDAWIVPVASVEPFPHHAPSDTYGVFNVYDTPLYADQTPLPYYVATQSYATLFSVTEGPVISIPAGLSQSGLPVGVQLVGRRYEDLRLLGVARLIEPLLDRPVLSLSSADRHPSK